MVTLTRMTHPGRRALRRWIWATLVGYTAVVVALTCLKAWFAVGLLWKPENQRVRELRLRPFGILDDASTFFGAAFDILGNVAFFVPLGLMLALVMHRFWWPVVVCAGLSLVIETAQFMFSLGRTDVTDLICNVAGGAAGAAVCVLALRRLPVRWDRWALLCCSTVTALILGFLALVALGPALATGTVPDDQGLSF